jgi:hypothetical protein
MSTKVTIVLPTCYNDGKAVPLRDSAIAENAIIDIAGGFTAIRNVIGAYRMANGELCVEINDQYTIICDNAAKVEALRDVALQACKDFRQECVYFETSECNVEFIR